MSFSRIDEMGEGEKKARVHMLEYEFPVPAPRQFQVQQAADRLLADTRHLIQRERRSIDLREQLVSLAVESGTLRFALRFFREGSVRPREVLTALGIDDLEGQGFFLTRTRVVLESDVDAKSIADKNGHASITEKETSTP